MVKVAITSMDYISFMPKNNNITTSITAIIKAKNHAPVVATFFIPKKIKSNDEAYKYLEKIIPCLERGDSDD